MVSWMSVRCCGEGGDQDKTLPRYIIEGNYMGEHGMGVNIEGLDQVTAKDDATKCSRGMVEGST
jgi:hypothetical protein